jgi:twitching motility protein PilT
MEINNLLSTAKELQASDIHLFVSKPPLARVDGVIRPISEESQPLTSEDVHSLIDGMLNDVQRARFDKDKEIDLSYQIPSGDRFRVNCHFERDNEGMVARFIPEEIPNLEMVHMPEIVSELIKENQGIILVTGPTGCGKSTSLAAMINEININQNVHMITLEDPIEFLYKSKNSVIRQRQYGTDFLSFPEALRRILRQDPDVILVGEMRDFETIAAALTLAETGHLVLATLHTNSAAQTIERIIDVFPPHQQEQIRTQLSMTLKAVISQNLVPKKGGGRIAIREVMMNTPAVANTIRDNRIAELSNVIQTGGEHGMVTIERDVARLIADGLLDRESAKKLVDNPDVLKKIKTKKGFFK